MGSLEKKNSIKIGDNSNKNTVFQNCDINNVNVLPGESSMISFLGRAGQYSLVQEYLSQMMATAAEQHPLFPDYSASWDSGMKKLISTPATEAALQRYPKNIKGKLHYNIADYQGFCPEKETIWEYGYRTQKPLTFDAEEYKEYLGDLEDPYPVVSCYDGLKITMVPPPFPSAVQYQLFSDNQSYFTTMQRIPCLEYGKVILQNDETDSLGLQIIFDTVEKKIRINLSKRKKGTVSQFYARELFLAALAENKKLQIINGSTRVLEWTLKEKNYSDPFFLSAKGYCLYLGVLFEIENRFGCSFSVSLQHIDPDDLMCVRIFNTYLKEPSNWYHESKDFDDGIRVDYNSIPDFLLPDNPDPVRAFRATGIRSFSLHGVEFEVGQFSVVYNNVKINNKSAVRKAIKKRRTNFPITFRPATGETFDIYYKFEDVKLKNGN